MPRATTCIQSTIHPCSLVLPMPWLPHVCSLLLAHLNNQEWKTHNLILKLTRMTQLQGLESIFLNSSSTLCWKFFWKPPLGLTISQPMSCTTSYSLPCQKGLFLSPVSSLLLSNPEKPALNAFLSTSLLSGTTRCLEPNLNSFLLASNLWRSIFWGSSYSFHWRMVFRNQYPRSKIPAVSIFFTKSTPPCSQWVCIPTHADKHLPPTSVSLSVSVSFFCVWRELEGVREGKKA